MTISVLVLGVCVFVRVLKVENDDSLHYRSGLARIASLITRKCMNMSGCHFQYSICALNNRVIQDIILFKIFVRKVIKCFWREIELCFGSNVRLLCCSSFLQACKKMSEEKKWFKICNFSFFIHLFLFCLQMIPFFVSQTAKHVMSNPTQST